MLKIIRKIENSKESKRMKLKMEKLIGKKRQWRNKKKWKNKEINLKERKDIKVEKR